MRKVWSLFIRRQTTVSSAAIVLISMVFVSRILGLVRDRLLAARFAPDSLGVYFAAFRIPNVIFELLVMGALTSAFIPVFTKYLARDQKDNAWRMASTLIHAGLLILFSASIPVLIFTPQISRFLAPGFTSSEIIQMVWFTRFMIVFQVVPLLIGNFYTGILQSYNLFLIPALAPVLYNLGIIISIIFLSPAIGLFAPVAGVGLGALLFLVVQFLPLRSIGYQHHLVMNLRDPGVKEVAKLMSPRTLGLAVSQIDTTVDLMLASLLGARMVTIFNFAQHLQQLPVGLFGATIAQAALPTLSVSSVGEDKDAFITTVIRAIHQILFFVLPVGALFIVLRIPIVRLVFGAAQFDWQATVLTGMTLSAFSVSLFAQSVSHVLSRGFYALYDTKTPVIIAVITILINSILSIVFIIVYHFPVWSLGLSTSIASIINTGLLFIVLDKRVKNFPRRQLFGAPFKMLLSTLAMAVTLYVPVKLLDQLVFDTTRTIGLIFLTGVSSTLGLATYFFLSWVLDVGEVQSLLRLFNRVKRLRGIIFEPAREVVNGGIQDKIS